MANRPVPLSLTLFAVVLTAAVAILGTILFQGRIGTTSNAKPGVTGTPDATVAAADSAQYLFTQSYTGGTISGPNNHNLLVTLHGLRRAVTAFTDRPERQANLLATSDFYQLWDSWFETDPPNGVLSFTPEGSKEPVGIVVRLTDPHYFAATGTVVYHAVKIPKSDQLFPGAQALVTPSDDDPNYHNRTKSFGPGMLFIDDASSFQTSLTGFFGSSASPAIGTALSNVTLTPSLTLGSVKITGYSNGIYTGDLNMTLGAESGETPIAATGTFTWTDSNDWTMTIASASTTGDVSLSGTITDTAGALSGNLADTTPINFV